MNDKPITFRPDMIRALLDGRKTQTRQIIKSRGWLPEFCGGRDDDKNDPSNYGWWDDHWCEWVTLDQFRNYTFVPYAPGDRLWVREAWNTFTFSQDGEKAWPTDTIPTAAEMQEIKESAYRFDTQIVYRESDRAREWFSDQKWCSPIHMPRWASRLTLVVTDVCVQRVQDISEDDAFDEGVERPAIPLSTSRVAFRNFWNSIHSPDAWDQNPWVAAISFDVHKCNIDQMDMGANS